MLLRLRDEFRIVLSPRQVVLARMKRELTHRGMKRRLQAKLVVHCDEAADDEVPWSPALKAAESALPGFAGARSRATVILSNHFMRYVLVPWNDALSDAREEMVYAQHSFCEMYGRDCKAWELRMSTGRTGIPQVASAVDTRLLEDLRESLDRSGVVTESIQPHLMMAYNTCHALLRDRSAWLAIVEEGNLCLALLQEGRWIWVRTIRTGMNWQDELLRFLEREAFISNAENGTDEVYVWAPEHEAMPVAAGVRWKIVQLQPPRMPAIDPELDGRFAMYMSE